MIRADGVLLKSLPVGLRPVADSHLPEEHHLDASRPLDSDYQPPVACSKPLHVSSLLAVTPSIGN